MTTQTFYKLFLSFPNHNLQHLYGQSQVASVGLGTLQWQESSTHGWETAGSKREIVILTSSVPGFVSSSLESSYHNSCVSLTFPGKLQLCKESGEGAGVCVKMKQREQSLILLPKSLFFFLLVKSAIFKSLSACKCMCSNCPEHIWIMSPHPSVMWCRTATLYFAFSLWWRYFMTVFESRQKFSWKQVISRPHMQKEGGPDQYPLGQIRAGKVWSPRQ